MSWSIEYYEQQNGTQPAEVFEDVLRSSQPKLAGKLRRIALELETYGTQLGGGYLEACRGYSGLWEIRAIHSQWLGRELLGFDGHRVVLLHGYVKRGGQAASTTDLKLAFAYLKDYQLTRKISPEQVDVEDGQ